MYILTLDVHYHEKPLVYISKHFFDGESDDELVNPRDFMEWRKEAFFASVLYIFYVSPLELFDQKFAIASRCDCRTSSFTRK
jgi:hypothetical protein